MEAGRPGPLCGPCRCFYFVWPPGRLNTISSPSASSLCRGSCEPRGRMAFCRQDPTSQPHTGWRAQSLHHKAGNFYWNPQGQLLRIRTLEFQHPCWMPPEWNVEPRGAEPAAGRETVWVTRPAGRWEGEGWHPGRQRRTYSTRK